MDKLGELLGITDEEYQRFLTQPRGCCDRTNDADVDVRPCREGCCAEYWCPCGTFMNSGAGPAGCPCDCLPPWKPEPPGWVEA